MKTIPIAFAFDENMIFPAKICISSLLMNANKDTFYDIFILYKKTSYFDTQDFDLLVKKYRNCYIQFRNIGNNFKGGFEIRGITAACYYRLLIPQVIPEYDKVIYADVDMIFRMDLSELYSMDLSGYYLAATLDLGLIWNKEGREYIETLHLPNSMKYIQSGFIMLNLEKMRDDNILVVFKKMYKEKLRFQDQDILNIVCAPHILQLSLKYNMTNYTYGEIVGKKQYLAKQYSDIEIQESLNQGNIHYNGVKPWKGYCINFDIWWEYYRKSIFFDPKYYFDFFYSKLNEYDCLSLWKRIKIVYRYFRYGKKKDGHSKNK